MQGSIFVLLASSTLVLSASVFPKLHADKVQKDGKSLMQIPSEELSTIFSSSIKYWDIDEYPHVPESVKTEMKRDIMDQLTHISEQSVKCDCPRMLGPLVCDKTGRLHASVCRYHCLIASREAEDLVTPIMILTETEFQQSKQKCQQFILQQKSASGTAMS